MMMETLPPGTKLRGRYRVERALGSGGFGHVYLVIDEQSNQQYAVKEYLVTGANGKAQLEHEARVLSQLHHPSLPAFQDAFDERGRYYVVLGYIDGKDLTDCIRMVRQKDEVVPLDLILRWLLSICDAVTFLHNQYPTIIHRDIKPDNIRITPDGGSVLVDLGNAKATADGARTLFFIRHQGTPGYAPLEQYPGGTGTDTRSDVYALGGTLYFALVAHEPPSVSTRNTSITQGMPDLPTLQEIVAQNPPATSADPAAVKQFRLGVTKPSKPAPRHSRHIAQLAALSPELLNQLNTIIHRAMAMNPKDRYQDVASMRNDIRSALMSLPQPDAASHGRTVDPHSTQPDLPFLYNTLQTAQDKNSVPAIPPAPQSQSRCPKCQAALPPSATFCPHCGTNLQGSPYRNSQAGASEPTMLSRSQFQSSPNIPQPIGDAPKTATAVSTASRPSQPGPFLQAISSQPVPAEPVMIRSSQQQTKGKQANANAQKFLFLAFLAFAVILLVILVVLFAHGNGHAALSLISSERRIGRA